MTKPKITVPELHIQLKNLCVVYSDEAVFWGFTRKTSRVHSRAFPEASPDRAELPQLHNLVVWEDESHFPSLHSQSLPWRSLRCESCLRGSTLRACTFSHPSGCSVLRFSTVPQRCRASDWLCQKREV